MTVAGRTFALDPAAVSFDIDEAAIAAQAMEQGREGHLGSQFAWWVRHFFGDEGRTLDMPYTYDEAALMEIVAEWEVEGIDNPRLPRRGHRGRRPGELPLPGGRRRHRAPRRPPPCSAPPSATRAGPRWPCPPGDLTPPLTEADIDAVVAEAEGLHRRRRHPAQRTRLRASW